MGRKDLTNNLLYSIVQDLDEQISKIQLHNSSEAAIKHLLELRNNIIQKYEIDFPGKWTIQNPKAQKVLKFFGWELAWKFPQNV